MRRVRCPTSRSSPPTADGEQAKQALRKVLGVLHRYLEPNGISKYDALNEILGGSETDKNE